MTTTTLAQKAATIGTPQTAGAPDKPDELPTVADVDWAALITAALGPTTSIDLPLPQLLLRLTEVVASLRDNGEHLKHFVGGTEREQEDLADKVFNKLQKYAGLISDVRSGHAALERRVEQLEAALTAPADLSSVQTSNAR